MAILLHPHIYFAWFYTYSSVILNLVSIKHHSDLYRISSSLWIIMKNILNYIIIIRYTMSSFLFALYFPATGFRKLPLVLFFSSWRAYSNLQNQARMKMWLKYRNFSNEILLLHYKLLIERSWNSLLMCSSFWGKISIRDTAIARACLASDAHFATVLLNYGQYNGFLRPIPKSMPMKTLHSTAELPNWEIQFTPLP